MIHKPIELKQARILVTNDDGIHAPGLKVLERIAKTLSKDVWVVAPESEQSAVAHSLTLRRPLRARRLGRRRFALDGTPTDCVLLAVRSLLKDPPPALVLSGINHGSNLGEDVTYSGTVAAAMEGALLGLRAIALSQGRGNGEIQWATAERFAPEIIRRLVTVDWPQDVLININFPPLPPEQITGIVPCRQGRRVDGTEVVEGRDPGGHPYRWIGVFQSDKPREKRTDLAATAGGSIAVTPLHLDLTHRGTLRSLVEAFR
ncbi:MAG: 5'/3'-nucleotidase SurE [Kiloniellales bacterium]